MNPPAKPNLPPDKVVYIISDESGLVYWLPLLWETPEMFVGDAGPRRRLAISKDPERNSGVWGYRTFDEAREASVKGFSSGVQRLTAELGKLSGHLKNCRDGLEEALTCTQPTLLDYDDLGPLGGQVYKIDEDQS
jgi:hypothetical protein